MPIKSRTFKLSKNPKYVLWTRLRLACSPDVKVIFFAVQRVKKCVSLTTSHFWRPFLHFLTYIKKCHWNPGTKLDRLFDWPGTDQRPDFLPFKEHFDAALASTCWELPIAASCASPSLLVWKLYCRGLRPPANWRWLGTPSAALVKTFISRFNPRQNASSVFPCLGWCYTSDVSLSQVGRVVLNFKFGLASLFVFVGLVLWTRWSQLSVLKLSRAWRSKWQHSPLFDRRR